MNFQNLKRFDRRGRTKEERKGCTLTKIPLMITNLHFAQCSYNKYSVRWLKLHCHETKKFRHFSSVVKCATKTGYGEPGQENLTKSQCSFHQNYVVQKRNL